MASSPFPLQAHTGYRTRPLNSGRDMQQLLRLLNQVFSPTLDAEGRRALNNMKHQSQSRINLSQLGQRIHPGFVHEFRGQLVGNVSLITTKTTGRVIIANVAVSPDHRRQGIGRQMLETAIQHLHDRHMHMVALQVDVDNHSAIDLYASLGFKRMGSTRYWLAAPGEWHEISSSRSWDVKTDNRSEIRPLDYHRWRDAYDLDLACQPLTLNWPELITPSTYRASMMRQIRDFLNGRQAETWMIRGNDDLLGIASIWSEWGKPHRLTVRVPDAYKEELTRPLLAKLLRRLRYLRRRYVSVEHRDDDPIFDSLLKAASFRPKRHLTTMKLDL